METAQRVQETFVHHEWPGGRTRPAPRRPSTPVQDAPSQWRDLTPMALDAATLRANRIVAQDGGLEAQPFDMLRTRLMRMVRDKGWKRIAVISPMAAAGKSTTLLNLSFALARQPDTRTIVVDFDLRRPALARLLGQKVPLSMGDVLSGALPMSAHLQRHGARLAFALTGHALPHTSEMLQGQRTEEILMAMARDYSPDLMLFDMPPVLLADDAHGFLRSVDAALIIAEADRTTVSQLDLVERQVGDLTNVAGVVLTKCHVAENGYGRTGYIV